MSLLAALGTTWGVKRYTKFARKRYPFRIPFFYHHVGTYADPQWTTTAHSYIHYFSSHALARWPPCCEVMYRKLGTGHALAVGTYLPTCKNTQHRATNRQGCSRLAHAKYIVRISCRPLIMIEEIRKANMISPGEVRNVSK